MSNYKPAPTYNIIISKYIYNSKISYLLLFLDIYITKIYVDLNLKNVSVLYIVFILKYDNAFYLILIRQLISTCYLFCDGKMAYDTSKCHNQNMIK